MSKHQDERRAAKMEAVAQQPMPPPSPEFPLLPLPFHYNVTQVPMTDGSIGVALILTTPGGSLRCVVPPDGAVSFGADLDRVGRLSKQGLIVP
jgi:hypothetical protein